MRAELEKFSETNILRHTMATLSRKIARPGCLTDNPSSYNGKDE